MVSASYKQTKESVHGVLSSSRLKMYGVEKWGAVAVLPCFDIVEKLIPQENPFMDMKQHHDMLRIRLQNGQGTDCFEGLQSGTSEYESDWGGAVRSSWNAWRSCKRGFHRFLCFTGYTAVWCPIFLVLGFLSAGHGCLSEFGRSTEVHDLLYGK